MRILARHSAIVLTFATMALACGNDRPANAPLSPPQGAVGEPKAAAPNAPPAPSPVADPHTAPPSPNDSSPATATLAPTRAPAPGEPIASTTSTTEKSLSDAEVLSVAAIANAGEVEMADLAIKKASSTDVKQFAAMMKTHHSAAVTKGKTLATKTKITPAESEVSSHLKSDVEGTIKDLKSKEGKDFDRAYMESQVKAHKDVLTTIDNRLIPSAANGEVKTMLTEMRQTVTSHLSKADEIVKKTP